MARRLKPSNSESASRASQEIMYNLRSIPFIILHSSEKEKEELKKALYSALGELDRDRLSMSEEQNGIFSEESVLF